MVAEHKLMRPLLATKSKPDDLTEHDAQLQQVDRDAEEDETSLKLPASNQNLDNKVQEEECGEDRLHNLATIALCSQ